jgi:phosphoribosylaminoimidazolecarboxamide formyltransferase/IMP cyclohydrolase
MPDAPATDSSQTKAMYKRIMDDHFPDTMAITLGTGPGAQTIFYEKVTWVIDEGKGPVQKGLRYGENPGQEAALYKAVNGNMVWGDVQCIQPGRHLASDPELLQSGKHPGKTNITDTDNALNILRYLTDEPTVVIVKHNNPCGVARRPSLAEAYRRADYADRMAAFGGAIALNRACDRETAEEIVRRYAEVVVAPEFEEGVMPIFERKKNLRVMRIGNMQRLAEYSGARFLDIKSLMDGGQIVQWSFVPETRTLEEIRALPGARTTYKGAEYKIGRMPTEAEYKDLLFGWIVEAGVASNSVLYVKDQVTVGIGTGQQDRRDVAVIARDKAYRKLADQIIFQRTGIPYPEVEEAVIEQRGIDGKKSFEELRDLKAIVDEEVRQQHGGLIGSGMVSDAFFPFRDGACVGIREGITAIVQPGGSDRDFETIEACNKANVAMVFTGQRSFKH